MTRYQPSLPFIAFLQATGLLTYCSLVGWIIWAGQDLFGPVPSLFGPVAFFLLFMISAVICALLYLGYPFIIFWEHKQTRRALDLVFYTTGWCALFLIILLTSFLLF